MLPAEIPEAALGHASQAEQELGAVFSRPLIKSSVETRVYGSSDRLRKGDSLLMCDATEPFVLLWSELYLCTNHNVMM